MLCIALWLFCLGLCFFALLFRFIFGRLLLCFFFFWGRLIRLDDFWHLYGILSDNPSLDDSFFFKLFKNITNKLYIWRFFIFNLTISGSSHRFLSKVLLINWFIYQKYQKPYLFTVLSHKNLIFPHNKIENKTSIHSLFACKDKISLISMPFIFQSTRSNI